MKKIKLSKKNKQNSYKLLAVHNFNNYDIEYILYEKLMQLICRYMEKAEKVYDLFKTYIREENYEVVRKKYIHEYKNVEKRFKNISKKMKKYNVFDFIVDNLIEFQELGENIIEKSIVVFDSQFTNNGVKSLEYNNIDIRKFKFECVENIKKKFKKYFYDKYHESI